MTADQLIDGILAREGGYANLLGDHGGPTKWGVTAATLGSWRGLGRVATSWEVNALTSGEARTYYQQVIANSPFSGVQYEPLRVQLVDFGVNSGNSRAVEWLQRVMALASTGVASTLTPRLLAQVNAAPGVLLNNALVAGRLRLVNDWTSGDHARQTLEGGLESRALSFLVDGGSRTA